MNARKIIPLLLLMIAAISGASEHKLFDELRLSPRSPKSFEADLPAVPAGRKPVLYFTARLQNIGRGVVGYTQALHISVNGRIVTGDYLLNKPLRPKTAEGALEVYVARHGFLLPYSFDFSSANRPDSPIQITLKPYDFYYFELDLSEFVKRGNNVITLIPRPILKTDIVFGAAGIVFKTVKDTGAAPVGELPVMVPEVPARGATGIRRSSIPLLLEHKGRQWEIASKFSTPDGKWATGSNAYFKHEREVKQLPEMVLVCDTFTNLTGEPLPVMQKHEVVLLGKDRKFYLGGIERTRGKIEGKFNCTSYGGAGGCGLGLYPANTEFQAHACNYVDKDRFGLADDQMVLPPRGQITQKFVAVPTGRADYWQFVNAVRRQIGANFTLDGCNATFAPVWKEMDWPDDKLRRLMDIKSVRRVILDTYGILTHGEFDRRSPKLEIMRRAIARFRRLFPDKKLYMYYHSQLLQSSDYTPYDADLIRDKDGKPVTYYGSSDTRISFTTLKNDAGRLFEERLKMFLDMGVDGVLWDETGYSMAPYHYGKPWDGISGDIDSQTHKLVRLKSSILLLQEPWKIKMMRMLQERNVAIQGNCTLSGGMLKFRFPTGAETDVLENCAEMALWSPLQYGDYTSGKETMESMCRAMHRGLDYGCLYVWPHLTLPRQPVSAQYRTIASYMYPATPVELREGVVFARERILTNRSGLFGWNDASEHEVHVFDEKGREQKNFKAPFVRRDGKTYTEIRIPRYWAAAIIRKGKMK